MSKMNPVQAFFFEKIHATGFGILRCLWGFMLFFWMFTLIKDVPLFFSDAGFLPTDIMDATTRSYHRFSFLDVLTSPTEAYVLYALLLLCALLTGFGVWCRWSTIATFILLCSFHERNLMILAGGDKVFVCVGFLLAVTPELRAFSIDRLRMQWPHWLKERTLLPPLTMSIWPYRLLLWQVFLIYFLSGFEKGEGIMWWAGTAAGAVYHHTHFARWPRAIMDPMSSPFISTMICYYTLFYEFLWLGILVPKFVTKRLPQLLRPGSFKRSLLLLGILFHVGIFVMTDVGAFPMAMLMTYFGLLLAEDWQAIKQFFNRRFSGTVLMLNDGNCGICRQTGFVIAICNWLGRIEPLNLHDKSAQQRIPEATYEDLLEEMHVKDSNGHIYRGFYAFRALLRHVPVAWPMLPLWYLPGVSYIGEKVYAKVASSRLCTIA